MAMAMRPSTPGQGTLTCKKVKGKLVRMVPSGGGSSGSAWAASCKPPNSRDSQLSIAKSKIADPVPRQDLLADNALRLVWKQP
jgi:hypothetical protein